MTVSKLSINFPVGKFGSSKVGFKHQLVFVGFSLPVVFPKKPQSVLQIQTVAINQLSHSSHFFLFFCMGFGSVITEISPLWLGDLKALSVISSLLHSVFL